MKNPATHSSGRLTHTIAPDSFASKIRKTFSRKPQVILVILLSVSLFLRSQPLFAQAPQQFSFQGVARGADGKILANKDISIDFRIYEGSPNGNTVFLETLSAYTNTSGIFNVKIGSNSNLNTINWEANSYFIKTSIFYDGLPDFVDLGTTQLLSVPYALFATKSTSSVNSVTADVSLIANKWVDNEPVIQTGSDVTGSLLPDVPSGNTLIWYPKNAAFRVGKHSGNSWTRSNIGTGSFATGIGTTASGSYSASFGTNSVATGANSLAAGEAVEAKAFAGTAIGSFNNTGDSPGATPFTTDRIFQIGNGVANAARSNALTVLRNGNIGIGNNVLNPLFALDVGARARIRSNGGGFTAGIYFDDSQNNAQGFVGMANDDEVGLFVGGAWRLIVNKNGTVYAQKFQSFSDRRLKTAISPVKNSLAKLRAIQGYNYQWKNPKDDQDLQTGVIAQELEEKFPELVSTGKDGYKAVNYIGLIPHLIEAVKELDKRTEEVAALKKELAEVKETNKRVMALEAGLKSLLTENKSAIGKSQAK